jgi:hypothetical protein
MANHYQLWTNLERDNNWLTMQDSYYGGPSIYLDYVKYLCPDCHNVDRAALFARHGGLVAGPQIRVDKKREITESGEGFLCIRTRVLKLLKRYKVAGFVSLPIPHTDWHALRITTKVRYKKFKPDREAGPPCRKCGWDAYSGLAEALSQIEVPRHENTFFTPVLERGDGQDVFLTEKVARMLKSEGARGASMHRLLSDEEYQWHLEDTPASRRKIQERVIWT